MKTKIYDFLRSKFHPLHNLRKSRVFREQVLPFLDRDVAVKGDFAKRIYVKAVTHSSFYMSADALEPRIKALLLTLVKALPANSVFFDVGANIGAYTWLLAGKRPDLKIVAIEPDPENFRLLTKTAQAWDSKNIYLRQAGLSDSIGTASFKRDQVTSATGSLEKVGSFAERHFNLIGETIEVPTTTLDKISEEEGMPALVKIDVEGHEPKVFAGAWDTIEKARPLIFFEFYSHDPVILSRLAKYGYLLFDADHGGIHNLQTLNFVAVQAGSTLEAVVREHLSSAPNP